jgi:hypothetical protein
LWNDFSLGGENMQPRKLALWFVTAGLMLLLAIDVFFLLPAQPASAQCGSQASSCKNCHETQGQLPVSNDLTTWHGQHAFGDFCYLCHGGNNQATDLAAAHTGMVYPLSDIVISCKSCHPNDYDARAQLYADTLGIKIGSLKATLAATESAPAAASAPSVVVTAVPQAAAVTAAPAAAEAAVVPASDLVDYSKRYDETVLGKKPVNTGNVILILMIAVLLLGGGYFILSREHLLKVSFQETKQIEGSYPADVVEMVPELTRLKASARADLRKILEKPGTAGEVFALVSKLSGKEEKPSTKPETPPEE